MENKPLEERKEEFKQATNQTVPVMGLEEDKSEDKARFFPNQPVTNADCDDTCVTTAAAIKDSHSYKKDDKKEEQKQDNDKEKQKQDNGKEEQKQDNDKEKQKQDKG